MNDGGEKKEISKKKKTINYTKMTRLFHIKVLILSYVYGIVCVRIVVFVGNNRRKSVDSRHTHSAALTRHPILYNNNTRIIIKINRTGKTKRLKIS